MLLDAKLRDAPFHFVDLLRQAVDGDAQAARRLVYEIDGLVGQKPISNVAIGERGSRNNRSICDTDAMVYLVPLLQTAKDRNCVCHAGLSNEYRLKAPLERLVLLDVLAVLVQRGCTYDMQFTTSESRLQHVRSIDGAFRRAGTYDRVQLVNEDHKAPFLARDLLQHGLEAFLELAAELGPGQHQRDIEHDNLLSLQRLGHVTVDDALRQTLDDRRLSHAGLADQYGIVLRAPRQNLHDAADLLVAADHRVQLAGPGLLGEIVGVLLERLVFPLRLLIGDTVTATHRIQRLKQGLAVDAVCTE